MAATLGLGSRANSKRSSSANMTRSIINGDIFQTDKIKMIQKISTPKRRGFGLFESDYEGDSDLSNSPVEPAVTFSGDVSGFVGLGDYSLEQRNSYSQAGSPTKSSSRTSALATPTRSRKNSIASRRATPYSTTTTRALQRARRESTVGNEEEKLISESMFGAAPDSDSGRKKKRFMMKGALVSPNEVNESCASEKDVRSDTERTPDKDLFSRNARTPGQSDVTTPQGSSLAKTTWRQWLKGIIPQSVIKPVSAIMSPAMVDKNSKAKDIFLKTPEKDISFSIPGSFDRILSATDPDFINPNFLNDHNSESTPIKISEGLFRYSQSPINLQPNPQVESPTSPKKGSRARSTPSSSRRLVAPPPVSFRKPSNFIERMRSTKKKRYDPYSRPSTAVKRATAVTHEEADRELTAEEELELLERRERDRKVQEAEDRYLRREALRKLGRPVEEEERQEISSPKHKAKFATVEDDCECEAMDEDLNISTTPPASPPQNPEAAATITAIPPTASDIPLFQNIAPSPAKEQSIAASTSKLEKSTETSSIISEIENDKENASSPPPPPMMSHRELPPIVVPPAALPNSVSNTNLFVEKQPIGGFGISGGATTESSSPVPVSPSIGRQRFDKFRPRVSSGLRESATIEKENEHDKENPSDSGGEGSSTAVGKPTKAALGTQPANKTSSSSGAGTGALREVQRNAPVQSGVKVDIRATIASLPVKDLSEVVSWSGVEIVSSGDARMLEAVKSAWNAEIFGKWATEVFGSASAEVQKI